jgi:hypothetical protein
MIRPDRAMSVAPKRVMSGIHSDRPPGPGVSGPGCASCATGPGAPVRSVAYFVSTQT